MLPTMTNVTVVVGGQFGSEGKGAITAHLARPLEQNDVVIRVAGPNAGHTAYDQDKRQWKLRAVPVAAVTNRHCQLHIAAGSEIDIEVLLGEINALDAAGHQVTDRLSIHPSATILEFRHQERESRAGIVGRIGSTGKGIGAARADRIMRTAQTAGDVTGVFKPFLSQPGPFDLDDAGTVIIEGTQGYGLGLHTQFYPQVTSSDCRAIDFLGMAGISPWSSRVRLDVVVVARIYPIRVAGNSGPLKDETDWERLGLDPERTTVTNKVRRVGRWDTELVTEAIRANGGGDYSTDVNIALTMVDQRFPELRDATELHDEANKFVMNIEDEVGAYIDYVGTGPNTVVARR